MSVFALGNYIDALRATIVEIKRDFSDIKAHQLGLLLAEQFELKHRLNYIDCVVHVPSHWRRRWNRRGFEPAAVLASGFCAATGLPLRRRALRCVKYVEKQSKMTPNQRIKNVKKTFMVRRSAKLQDLRVLLVDDVMTSGATAVECVNELKKAGVRSVQVAVAARAIAAAS